MANERNEGEGRETPTQAAGTGSTGDPAGAGATPEGAAPGGEAPLGVATQTDPFAERPEVFVGAAFAGGFVVAMILRRLTR
jgi:hypothetical protein